LFSIWSLRTGRFVPKCCARFDCFREGRRSDLIAFGPGVSGYFKFLKSVGILFLVLCIMSLPVLIVNVNGGSQFTHHPFPFAQTTIGNLFVQFNQTSFLLANKTAAGLNETIAAEPYVTYSLRISAFGCLDTPGACTFKRTDLLLAYSIWDAAMCFVIVFSVNVLMYFSRHETFIYKQKIPKIEDYSIETTVPDGASAKGLQMHFETLLKDISAANAVADAPVHKRFHDVYDVQIVESTGNAISLCIRRGILLKRLARLDARIKVMRQRGLHESRITPYIKKHEKTRNRIQALDERAVQRAEKGRALMAFITFETQEAKMRVLHEYDVFWVCGKEPEKLKYEGKDIVRIKQAPPPSTLLWENQEVSFWKRIIRVFLALLLFTGILGITAGLSFITDSNRVFNDVIDVTSGQTFIRCGGKYDNFTKLADAAAAAKTEHDTSCFCDFELLAPKPTGAEDNGFLFVPGAMCADYAFTKATSIGKEIGLSFVIMVINLIIFKIVIETAAFMKFRNVIDREFAILRTIFAITFINTAFISILVNANWSKLLGQQINDVTFTDGSTFIKIGQFVDFEPGWYSRVGVELFIIGLLNIVGPTVLPTLRYLYHVLERRYFAPFAVSQQVLNEMYIGEEFLLSVRLAQTLMMIFFILCYSSGMPIMYFVGFASVFVSYWFDKFYFTRLVRTPPQFDTALQVWTVKFIEWGVILHCLIGFWMYSSPRVFPLTDEEAKQSFLNDLSNELKINPNDASSASDYDFTSEFSNRLVRPESWIMLGAAAVILIFKGVRRFGRTALQCASPAHVCMNMIRALMGKQHQLRHLNKYVLEADNFEDAVKNGRVVGVRSYNILANPVYQRVFQIQDGFGQDHEVKSEKSSDVPDAERVSAALETELNKPTNAMGSYRGFQSLQDALNIRKGTAISTIESRSIWKDDGKSSVNSNASKQTTQLYSKKDSVKLDSPRDRSADSVASLGLVSAENPLASDSASTTSKSTKSFKKPDTNSKKIVFEEQSTPKAED
jgi:hypothetical protein